MRCVGESVVLDLIRHSDPESLYEAALLCVATSNAEGAKRRIDIASIHALAERQAQRSSELTIALRDAMFERVREGWTLRRVVSLTTQEGLTRERKALELIDAIPNARVEIRAIVVDAVPIMAPLIVGDIVAFLAFEDARDFAAADGLEFRSREAVETPQRYFDLLWDDPRVIHALARSKRSHPHQNRPKTAKTPFQGALVPTSIKWCG